MISILWLVPHSAMMPCQLIAWFIHVVWCFRYLTFLAVLHQPVQWLVQSLEWTCVRLTMELFCFFNCLHVWTWVSDCVWMDLNFIGSMVSECVSECEQVKSCWTDHFSRKGKKEDIRGWFMKLSFCVCSE